MTAKEIAAEIKETHGDIFRVTPYGSDSSRPDGLVVEIVGSDETRLYQRPMTIHKARGIQRVLSGRTSTVTAERREEIRRANDAHVAAATAHLRR